MTRSNLLGYNMKLGKLNMEILFLVQMVYIKYYWVK